VPLPLTAAPRQTRRGTFYVLGKQQIWQPDSYSGQGATVLEGYEYNSPVSERPRAGAHIGEASGAGFAISGRSRAFDHPSPGAVPPVTFLTSRAAHAHLDLWKRIKYHGSGVQTGGNWLTGGRTPNEDVASGDGRIASSEYGMLPNVVRSQLCCKARRSCYMPVVERLRSLSWAALVQRRPLPRL
jgi:hypothetical protein